MYTSLAGFTVWRLNLETALANRKLCVTLAGTADAEQAFRKGMTYNEYAEHLRYVRDNRNKKPTNIFLDT